MENGKLGPWINFEYLADLVLEISAITIMVLVILLYNNQMDPFYYYKSIQITNQPTPTPYNPNPAHQNNLIPLPAKNLPQAQLPKPNNTCL